MEGGPRPRGYLRGLACLTCGGICGGESLPQSPETAVNGAIPTPRPLLQAPYLPFRSRM